MNPLFRSISQFGAAMFVMFSTPGMANEYLSGKELRELLIGNTATGTYSVEGVQVQWHEFMSRNGNLYYIDGNGDRFTGSWEIKDDGCSYADYDNTDDGDGCYYYKNNADGTLTVKRPNPDAPPGIQSILIGNPKNLGK